MPLKKTVVCTSMLGTCPDPWKSRQVLPANLNLIDNSLLSTPLKITRKMTVPIVEMGKFTGSELVDNI